MIRPACAALLLVAGGCHDQRVLAPPPSDADSAGMVMVALDGDAVQWVTAFDLAAGGGYPALSWRGDPELVALGYGCPIERLGLSPGRQPLLDTPRDDLRLPLPRRIDSAQADVGAWSAVEMSDGVAAALRRLDLPLDNVCSASRAALDPVTISVPEDGHDDTAFLLPYDDESTLAGSRNGRVYRLHRSGALERVGALEDRKYRGAYLAADGELWMLSDRGTLARGSIDGLETVTTTTAFGPVRYLALVGPTDPEASLELFATSSSTRAITFARFDGERWQMLTSVRPHSGIFLPAAAWIAPGIAAAIGAGEHRNSVVIYDHGIVTEELLPSDAGPSSILHHPQLGTIVGMDDGIVARRSAGGDWRALPIPLKMGFVRTLAPMGRGLLLGGSVEFNFLGYRFAQYLPDIGYCEGEAFTSEAASHIAALGRDAMVAATLQDFGSPLGLTILELTAPAGACSGD